MKLLSTYYSDDETKHSNVFKIDDGNYRVTVKSDSGTIYSAQFDNEESAEHFAEGWVLNK